MSLLELSRSISNIQSAILRRQIDFRDPRVGLTVDSLLHLHAVEFQGVLVSVAVEYVCISSHNVLIATVDGYGTVLVYLSLLCELSVHLFHRGVVEVQDVLGYG